MSWNYRVWEEDGELIIKETYYNKEGEVCACTERGSTVMSDTIEGLIWNLEMMKECLEKPILAQEGFEFAKGDW